MSVSNSKGGKRRKEKGIICTGEMHYQYHLLKEHMYILSCTMLTVVRVTVLSNSEMCVKRKYRKKNETNGLQSWNGLARIFMSNDKGCFDKGCLLSMVYHGLFTGIGLWLSGRACAFHAEGSRFNPHLLQLLQIRY